MRLEQARRGAPARMPVRGRGGRTTLGRMKRRPSVFAAEQLGLMRLRRGWPLLLTVALGILAAVVLICAVPLFNNLVTDVELQRQINSDDPVARNVEIRLTSDAVTPTARSAVEPHVLSLAHRYVGAITDTQATYYAQSGETLLSAIGAHPLDISSQRPPEVRFRAFDYATTSAHMRFVAGRPPQTAQGGAPEAVPEAIVTTEMATDLHLTLGETVTVAAFGAHERTLTAKIVGVWTPVDAHDTFWNGVTFNASTSEDAPKIYPVLLTTDGLLRGLSSFQGLGLTQQWIYYTAPQRIDTQSIGDISSNLGALRSHVVGDLSGVSGVTQAETLSDLARTLDDIQRQQAFLALPLFVIVAQIVGLALLFVVSMASLLVDGQGQDIATLKSRGASSPQILSVYVTQGLILSLIAALAGPFIAAALALALARVFINPAALQTAGVSDAYLTHLANPAIAIIPALCGAALGVGAVAFAAWRSSRMEVLAFRREQARATRQPLWKRYYLDLALVAICAVGYVELAQFGGTTARLRLGGGASPLLLVTPALLLLAGALLVLRVVPLGAAWGARAAARGRGLISMLALSQVERSPARYTRMILLLVAAVGLGLFAVTFDASLAQNAKDRAAYESGADLRLVTSGPEGSGQDKKIGDLLRASAGVQVVSPAFRGRASTTSDFGNLGADVLGVSPDTFVQTTNGVSWRSDYAAKSLTALMGDLAAQQRGQSAGSSSSPIYAFISETTASALNLKRGDHFTLQLNDSAFGGTSFIVGEILRDFPTLYPTQSPAGFIVIGLDDYEHTLLANANGDTSLIGPNEFWMKTSQSAADETKLLNRLRTNADFDEARAISLRQQTIAAQSNPVGTGMRGLLFVGAITAALLAVLASIVQSIIAVRQRATQFAILRTLGTARTQLTGLLLSEQTVVYLFGLLGGTLLGLLLTTATLPFLQFSDSVVDPSRIGVPPYQLVFAPQATLYFYAALAVSFVLALAVSATYAATVGLGQTLRLGED
jgi:putative ABC transport system permease protein